MTELLTQGSERDCGLSEDQQRARLLLRWLLRFRKLPAAELEMFEDLFRYRKAILLFQRLSEPRDRHLLQREGNHSRRKRFAQAKDAAA